VATDGGLGVSWLGRGIRARLPSPGAGSPLVRQFASLAVSNVGVAFVSFAVLVALARGLSTKELGQVVFAQAAAQALFALLDPRLDDALIRYMPVVALRRGGRGATALFRRFLLIDQGLGATFAVVAITVVVSGAVPMGGTTEPAFLALALAQMGARAAQGTASAGYAVTEGLARFGAVQAGAAVTVSGAGLFGLLVGGAEGYLAGAAIAATTATAWMSFSALRRVRRRYGPPARHVAALMPGMVGFTWKSSLASSLAIGVDQLPLTVVGAVAGPQTLAVVRVALGPARLAAAVYSPIASVLYPVFSRDAARDDINAISHRARNFSRTAVPLAAAGSLIGWAVLPPLVPLFFGSSFDGAGTAAVLLLAGALLRGSVAWSKVLPLALGRPGIRIAILVGEGVLMVGGAVLFADEGATAVAAVYLVTAALSTVTWLALLSRASRYAERWDDQPAAPAEEVGLSPF
jgi:O-antigen/teichoic acid export membrane protein